MRGMSLADACDVNTDLIAMCHTMNSFYRKQKYRQWTKVRTDSWGEGETCPNLATGIICSMPYVDNVAPY